MKNLLLLLILFPFIFTAQSQEEIDSLTNELKTAKHDTTRVKLLNILGQIYLHTGSYDLSKSRSEECILLIDKAQKNRNKLSPREIEIYAIGKAESYTAEGFCCSEQGDYQNAKTFLIKAMKVYFNEGNKLGLTRAYNNLGLIEFENGNYSEAIQYHLKSLKLNEEIGNIKGRASNLNNLGNVYITIKKFDEAKKMFREALALYIKNERPQGIANAYNNIGLVCEDQLEYDSAIYYLNKALKIRIELNEKRSIAGSHTNLAGVYYKQKNLKEAIIHFNKALQIKEEIGDLPGLGSAYLNLASMYSESKRNADAIALVEKGLKILKEIEAIDDLKDAYDNASKIYAEAGNYQKAYEYHVEFSQLNDSLFNQKNTQIIEELSTKYETDKKEKENKLLQSENRLSMATIKEQKLVTIFISVGLLLVVILAFFIFNGLKKQRKANEIISEQKKEVESQKHLVEEKQKEILDSIHYAKRIQTTLLAHTDFVNQYIPHNFIFFKPKDIVSGDFYWATKKDDLFYLAVCDSTGHGVPGAFMSLLNINFLNEAITEKQIAEPHQIFNFVRQRLIDNISKEGQKDGFDGILLCLNLKTKKVTYSAANNAPILIRNGEILELGKDRMPVGKGERTESFTLHEVELQKEDTLYLYTDGYADQFGGPKGKKFLYKRLNEFILSINDDPFVHKGEKLNLTFENWKGNLEQVDDVLIIGVKI